MEGPPVSEWFKDLGVIQNVGKKRTKGPMRLEGAIARVQRVGRLSLPLHKRAYIITASGISAAVYGQASNLVTVGEIRKLRTAMKRSLVKQDKFASQEPLFSCLGLSWRLDPGVHALIGPWKVFALGLRQGTLDFGMLAEMWEEAGGTTGPIANAKAGLRRAGIEGGIEEWVSFGDKLTGPMEGLDMGDRRWMDFLF